MPDTIIHSFHATTFHIFRYGRSQLYAATLDRKGSILPRWKQTWDHAWSRDYHEGDGGCGFDAEEALTNIESDGYHLFKCRAPAVSCATATLPPDVKQLRSLILELRTALEHSTADEKTSRLNAENRVLLKNAEAVTRGLDQNGL